MNNSAMYALNGLTIQALRSPDICRDEVLTKFTDLVSETLNFPSSFIAILDDHYQYIKASHNFDLDGSVRSDSLCQYVADDVSPLIIPDTHADSCFASNPFVTGSPFIRFYAGVPLKNREGAFLGTLCVTDSVPRSFNADQLATLEKLSQLVISFLEAWHSAGFTDPVTGIPNRQQLIRNLHTLGKMEKSSSYRLILIDLIDIPRAYELARTLGMGPVEGLLRDMATLIPLRLRPGPDDFIYTVATGRFALLTKASTHFTAEWVATKLAGVSADMGEGLSVGLTTHTGEALFKPGKLSPHEVLRKAVSALHEAICQGVSYMSFSEKNDERRTDDFTLVNDLATAIRFNQGLYLVYQPKICLNTGLPIGLEALIRWRHPVRGELSPSVFIPLAEQTTLLQDLTEWVIGKTIERLKRLDSSPLQLPVTVNVSVRDFSQEGFADRLETKMINARLSPELLGIECLETERIIESAAAMAGLEMLKLRGFNISLDDFGTGYSNISYLRRMPLDVIKLDRSIINGLTTDTASRIITKSIISMLKELDYVVLAEGVENVETLDVLREFGCDQAQGFYHSRPLPEPELDEWLSWKICR